MKNRTNLGYSEIIEKTIKQAEKMALGKKQKIHPLHFLFNLIKNDKSESAQVLNQYADVIEKKIADLPSDLSSDKTFLDDELHEWIRLAKANALTNNRQLVKESDFLDQIGEFFNVKIGSEQKKNTKEEKAVKPTVTYKELSEQVVEQKMPPHLEKMDTNSVLLIENEGLITSMIESLSRQDLNNIALYGEKGVGKTSLVKALSKRISDGSVPSFLKNKTIYRLKTAQITLNTHDVREVSDRMETVLDFIKDEAENRILFISDFDLCLKNQLMLDNIKYYIIEYNLKVIAEMSYDNYDKFTKDSQLKNQFNAIFVKEPSIEESILIVEKIVPGYETSKGLYISKEVVQSAVELSAKQISGEFLPSKAINVLDQACAKFVLHLEMPSTEEAQLQDKVKQLQGAIKYSKDKNKVTELDAAVVKLDGLKKERQSKIDKFKTVPLLQFEINSIKDKDQITDEDKTHLSEKETELSLLKDEVSLNKMDICEVISQITEIPKEKIAQSKQDNILTMDKSLEQRVFGQSEAIKKITDILMTSFAGLAADQKPLGSFLLLGPSGVGKTEIAKALTEMLFDHEKYMIRLDLSEYSEKHAVAKLIGAPAGYAGYEDGGVLTEAVRKNPYSVILFDEVEKGHKDFADILLQILDDGRLTDNKGRTVNFNNTIIFLTSNLKDPTTYFRPEMIGRFSDVVKFNPLAMEVMPLLVNKELKALNKKLAKQNLKLELAKELIDYLSKEGHSVEYGARPMIRLFNNRVSKPLAQQILAGKLKEGVIKVGLENGEVVFKDANGNQNK